jgi:predicted tellurium resistance membrane protein TerC
MDRYPIILWIGAAVLGKVGGQMMITDPWVHGLLNSPNWVEYASMVFFVLFIVVLAKILIGRRSARNASGPALAKGTETI